MDGVQMTCTLEKDFVYEDQNPHVGWICPKCGRAVSPEYKTCPYCSTQYTDENLGPGQQMICDANL